MKIIAKNRKAYHNFEILDKYEAGISLVGTEVKSVRAGNVNFIDSFAHIDNGEMFLSNLDIQEYREGNIANHEPRRKRKLLLHKLEIFRLNAKIAEKGLTLIPLIIYFNKKGKIKVELGLCRGKNVHDKRKSNQDKEAKRAIRKAMNF